MTVRRLSAVDAQTYWMSAKIPNDQFLLYGFAGVPSDVEAALHVVRERAQRCPELRLRVRDRGALTYAEWVAAAVDEVQFVAHDLADSSWSGCLAAIARLFEVWRGARRADGGLPGAVTDDGRHARCAWDRRHHRDQRARSRVGDWRRRRLRGPAGRGATRLARLGRWRLGIVQSARLGATLSLERHCRAEVGNSTHG
jgi:hypothetical protein